MLGAVADGAFKLAPRAFERRWLQKPKAYRTIGIGPSRAVRPSDIAKGLHRTRQTLYCSALEDCRPRAALKRAGRCNLPARSWRAVGAQRLCNCCAAAMRGLRSWCVAAPQLLCSRSTVGAQLLRSRSAVGARRPCGGRAVAALLVRCWCVAAPQLARNCCVAAPQLARNCYVGAPQLLRCWCAAAKRRPCGNRVVAAQRSSAGHAATA